MSNRCDVCHLEASIPEKTYPFVEYPGGETVWRHAGCNRPQDWFQDVLEFHKKFGVTRGSLPAEPANLKTVILRETLILEECAELSETLRAGNLPGIADGLADLVYVLLGTAITYGIDLRPVWNEVHRTNMLKEGGNTRKDGKILKPEGWEPPCIAELLETQTPIDVD